MSPNGTHPRLKVKQPRFARSEHQHSARLKCGLSVRLAQRPLYLRMSAVATDMLVSHWLSMIAAVIKLFAPCFCTWGPAEAAGMVAQYGNEAAASRADSRLSNSSQATSVSAASTSLAPVSVLSAGAELMELGMVRHGMSRKTKSSFKAPALAPPLRAPLSSSGSQSHNLSGRRACSCVGIKEAALSPPSSVHEY